MQYLGGLVVNTRFAETIVLSYKEYGIYVHYGGADMMTLEEYINKYYDFCVEEGYFSEDVEISRIPELEENADIIINAIAAAGKKQLTDPKDVLNSMYVNDIITVTAQAGTIMAEMYNDGWEYMSLQETIKYITDEINLEEMKLGTKFFDEYSVSPYGYQWDTSGLAEGPYRDIDSDDQEWIDDISEFVEKYRTLLKAAYILGITYQMNADKIESEPPIINSWFTIG